MSPLRVLIVADDPLARAGLAALLAELPELVIAGRIAGSDDIEAAMQVHQPDVLLWDIGWKPEGALARLADRPPGLPVVALVEDEAFALAAWQAGAQGVLARDRGSATLSVAALSVALLAAGEGLSVLDARFRAPITGPAAPPAPRFPGDEAALVEELTPRELEVLRLLAEGLPNKAIAQRLDISEHTVKFHVNALLGKLGVGSRTEAVVRATRLGLVLL